MLNQVIYQIFYQPFDICIAKHGWDFMHDHSFITKSLQYKSHRSKCFLLLQQTRTVTFLQLYHFRDQQGLGLDSILFHVLFHGFID